MGTSAGLKMLDPTAQPVTIETVGLAARPDGLHGLRLGLVDNRKHNAAALLEEVLVLLQDDLRPSEVVRRSVPTTMPAPDELLDEIARDCDLVIEAVGD